MFLEHFFIETYQPYLISKDWFNIFFVIFTSFLFSLILTSLIRVYAEKFSLYSRNEKGRKENTLKNRFGGIAIVLSFLIIFIAINFLAIENNLNIFSSQPFPAIFLGAISIFLIGIVDDIIYLSPRIRLFFQIIIGILVWFYGLRLGTINITIFGFGLYNLNLNPFLNLFITVIFLVGMLNALNWIDGLDGLAAGNTLITLFGISILFIIINQPKDYLLLPLSLAGCCLGFLKFNSYPAKIYMGDGGSNFLGFMMAAIMISITQFNETNISFLKVIFINFLPIINMSIVTFERIINGCSPFYPDRRHIHYKIMNMGLSHKNSVMTLYLFSGLFVFLGLII